MGDRQGRPSAVNLCPFVGVKLWTLICDRPISHSHHRADTDVKWIRPISQAKTSRGQTQIDQRNNTKIYLITVSIHVGINIRSVHLHITTIWLTRQSRVADKSEGQANYRNYRPTQLRVEIHKECFPIKHLYTHTHTHTLESLGRSQWTDSSYQPIDCIRLYTLYRLLSSCSYAQFIYYALCIVLRSCHGTGVRGVKWRHPVTL